MNFNSIQYLVFLPLVSTVYFIIPHRWRILWLLIVSCYFYMAFIPIYILILLLLIIIDFTMGLCIDRSQGIQRKIYLIISISSTCLILFTFKYFNFFNSNLASLAQFLHWNYPVKSLSLLLPLGLSFHTFQSLGYVFDVYYGRWKAEKNFLKYSLYVMFFPQLVSGPIERANHFLPQLNEKHDFDSKRVANGLKLILWGFFQKVVIADRLSLVVNQVYGHAYSYQGLPLIIATVFFAFQIYCDFSGYSDIAIGTAQIFGFDLIKNFNQPYLARSIAEFWRRWHISLSTWFRDYLYIPLGGNKSPQLRWTSSIIITFLISGMWHGSNWTYLIWGALHAFYYLCSRWTTNFRQNIIKSLNINPMALPHQILRILITFILVSIAWIFFRASSIHEAMYTLTHLFSGLNQPLVWNERQGGYLGVSFGEFLGSILLIMFLLGVNMIEEGLSPRIKSQRSMGNILILINQQTIFIRWAVYIIMSLSIMNLGIMTNVPFIYFQF